MLPFGETALFMAPTSHTRQLKPGVQLHKGDSTFVKGVWVGKHDASDDHIFLTAGGWHRARTVRRLEPSSRAQREILLTVQGAPWDRLRRFLGRLGRLVGAIWSRLVS